MQQHKDRGRSAGLGLIVAPLLFGLYLAFFTDARPGGGGDAVSATRGGGHQYVVRLRCPDDAVEREHLYARSLVDALVGAERLNPRCEALSANRLSG